MPVNHRQPRRITPHQAYRQEAAGDKTLAVQGRYGKTALAYAGITVLCLVFCAIYEIFSFGEHSRWMRMMFMIPLLGGAAPFALMAVSEKPPSVSRTAFNLWNSGLAVHVSGCLVHGIIEISGRVPDYDGYYWAVSGIFLILAVILQLTAWHRAKAGVRRR
jgi:hypothetical protein